MEGTLTRNQAELALAQASFALLDLHLYLDTHPQCQKALACYRQRQAVYEEARAAYLKSVGPITAGEDDSAGDWAWIDEPWPWQEEE